MFHQSYSDHSHLLKEPNGDGQTGKNQQECFEEGANKFQERKYCNEHISDNNQMGNQFCLENRYAGHHDQLGRQVLHKGRKQSSSFWNAKGTWVIAGKDAEVEDDENHQKIGFEHKWYPSQHIYTFINCRKNLNHKSIRSFTLFSSRSRPLCWSWRFDREKWVPRKLQEISSATATPSDWFPSKTWFSLQFRFHPLPLFGYMSTSPCIPHLIPVGCKALFGSQ